jgi:CBS domain containing-hemolysin-like protein
MSFPLAVLVTVLLLIGSGFFVAAEFALVAAKRHRMEKAAAAGQRGAKAALAGMRELSLMLAGAQLGITVCTLGLGSVSKPAISHELDPVLHALGLPAALSYAVAFAVAMIVVVFLHMVLGEMAPKSWAIAHPERSAMLLSPPFRAVARSVRPLIWVLNKLSNGLVRMCRVTPRDELAAVHNREQLTRLIDESERLGLISASNSDLLTRSLTEPETPVDGLQVPAAEITSVDGSAGVDDLLALAASHDRTRMLVHEDGRIVGSVHVRDALVARAQGRPIRARDLARPVPGLPHGTTVADAIELLRGRRASLAVVRDDTGRVTGMVALDDLLARYLQPQTQPQTR